MSSELQCSALGTFKPSFLRALDGYDLGRSNPYAEDGDPAVRGRIFDIDCDLCNMGAVCQGYYNFVSFEVDVRCDSEFSSKTINNYKEYLEEREDILKAIILF